MNMIGLHKPQLNLSINFQKLNEDLNAHEINLHLMFKGIMSLILVIFYKEYIKNIN